jgi:hypothetical protein
MNLHGIVRGAINSVNADKTALYLKSTGNTVNADFSQTPSYAPGLPVRIQIQPLGKEELRHIEKLNLQGVYRTIYMYGNTQGVVRIFVQGGDLIQFTPFQGQPPQNWKVVGPVDGPWNVEYGGWTKFLVCLQTDTPALTPGIGT